MKIKKTLFLLFISSFTIMVFSAQEGEDQPKKITRRQVRKDTLTKYFTLWSDESITWSVVSFKYKKRCNIRTGWIAADAEDYHRIAKVFEKKKNK